MYLSWIYLFKTECFNGGIHDGNESIEEDNDDEQEIQSKVEHCKVSQNQRIAVVTPKLLNICAWVENVPK